MIQRGVKARVLSQSGRPLRRGVCAEVIVMEVVGMTLTNFHEGSLCDISLQLRKYEA